MICDTMNTTDFANVTRFANSLIQLERDYDVRSDQVFLEI